MTSTVIHALAAWSTLLGVATGVDGAQEAAPPQDAATRAVEHVSQGARLRTQGEIMMACRHFRHAAVLTPTWPMARLELGRCLRLLGDPLGDAEVHLRAAQRGMPERPAVLLELGRLAEDRGDRKEARAWYRAAAELDEGSMEAKLALARLGCSGAGLASFEHARRLLRADAGDPAAQRAMAEASLAAGFTEQAREAFSWLAERAKPSWRARAAQARFEQAQNPPSAVSDARSKRRRARRRR